ARCDETVPLCKCPGSQHPFPPSNVRPKRGGHRIPVAIIPLTWVPVSTIVNEQVPNGTILSRRSDEHQRMEALVGAIVMQVLVNSPWWVFALFSSPLAPGLLALRPRVAPPWRLLVTPAVFIGWALISLILRFTPSSPLLAFDWVAAAAVGGVLARATI